jgi:hypothetical protein
VPSTQTLITVRCIGRRRSRWRTPGPRITGRIAATIGRKRTLDNVTASATSQSDAVVSVEMIEAVGEEYWETYFRTID